MTDAAASAATSPARRLAMMWELVLQAWAVAGRPLPDDPRHEAPVRILGGGARS